jgi:hypothetical protein
VVKTVAESFKGYPIDNLTNECSHEELTCLNEADATLLHVEESILIKLAYGSAVATLHVISIDFELGLSIHACLTCET